MLYTKKEQLEQAADLLKAIAHPTRLAVASLLQHHARMSVSDLSTALGCEQSLLSHHLANMRLKGILKAEKEGLNVYYSLLDKNLPALLDCIEQYNF
jgi:DNA-binding transcriptional ArsR family regulator